MALPPGAGGNLLSEAIRSFVALSISEGARRQIADLLVSLQRQQGPVVRWVRPELMHLTLAFLGEVPQEFLDAATARLSAVARQHSSITAQLRGLGAFPSSSRARVVWIGTEQGRREVCNLQAEVVRALTSVGYQPERRPFSPHLTIGRLRTPDDVSKAAAVRFESEPFVIDRFVLMRSVLGPAGPAYSVLAEFPLAVQTTCRPDDLTSA
ncbi:RNA 2',3'-cyclic phosphodiesterase [candidate division WOR-3 bacterium]|uniref:RNA 2',3'-cyclic phosphodiesterase n=1 Tax=candidate division WOR-3 bacterium TaxID=2052148 RepID=A0A938BSJ0_UNCW3|nr:RNA 2',3'-cyclic phosphodiesterase [candidate division WOR-3 bacterium]